MSRIKGSRKCGGRQAGTPNKITAELRVRIKSFLENNFTTVEHDFKKLDPEKRIALYEKYLKFALPQLQTTSVDLNIEKMTDEELTILINRMIKR
jgi:hypothetical protein